MRDVCQWPALGKKGRLASAVQILCDPAAVDAVADACLTETSTIGLRWRIESRRVLPRETSGDGASACSARTAAPPSRPMPTPSAGTYAARAARRREVEQG